MGTFQIVVKSDSVINRRQTAEDQFMLLCSSDIIVTDEVSLKMPHSLSAKKKHHYTLKYT